MSLSSLNVRLGQSLSPTKTISPIGGINSLSMVTTGSPSSKIGLCRKFAPNIFNKSKCQNCFRLREAHTADALETSRITRNVVKCGYLFVAPDWDFTSQSNRTKRWQRRWFVLFDDGELTYALDEQPDTIPQASIDMKAAVEVALADELTGNSFSIAVTTADKIHFIKATSREDAKWWYEALCRAAPNLRSPSKRNQTLPVVLPSSPANDVVDSNRDCNRETAARQRYYSVSGTTNCSPKVDDKSRAKTEESNSDYLASSMVYQFVSSILNQKNNLNLNTSNSPQAPPSNRDSQTPSANIQQSQPTTDIYDSAINIDDCDVMKKRRFLKRETKALKSQRSRSDGVAKMLPNVHLNDDSGTPWNFGTPATSPQRITPQRSSVVTQMVGPNSPIGNPSAISSQANIRTCHSNPVYLLLSDLNRSELQTTKGGSTKIKLTPPYQRASDASNPDTISDKDRDEIDGGTTTTTSSSTKKGFLHLRQRYNGQIEWTRTWFVLRNNTLSYYSDVASEEKGHSLGVVDMGALRAATEIENADRNYAFAVVWSSPESSSSSRELILSASTVASRANWLQAIRQASSSPSISSHLTLNTSSTAATPAPHGNNITSVILGSPSSIPATGSGSAMHTSHSAQYRRSSPTRNTANTAVVKDLTLSFQERSTPSKRVSTQSSGSGLSPESGGEEGNYFSANDSTPTQELPQQHKTSENTLCRGRDIERLPPSPAPSRTALSKAKHRGRSSSSSRGRLILQQERSDSLIKDSSDRNDGDSSGDDEDLNDQNIPPGSINDRRNNVQQMNRLQSLEHKLRVSRRDLEAKQAEVDALRGVVEEYNRKSLTRSSSDSRASPDESEDAIRRSSELVAKSLQLLKTISSKSALKEVKEKCLDLQSHILSMETLMGEFVENLSKSPEAMGARLSRANAAVQTSNVYSDERLVKAQREVSRLSKELVESQKSADEAELQLLRTSNEKKMADEEYRQQSTLLNMRIDDLTNKLNASEKNIQLMKHKLARVEKRRLSLRGKESLNLSKDIETKLSNLEAKMIFLEDLNTMTDSQSDISEDLRSHSACAPSSAAAKPPVSRRLSTDSQNSETTPAHRIFNLDQKVKTAVEAVGGMPVKPKIYLQTRSKEHHDDDWATLSLTASMTDLTELDADLQSLSPHECLETLSHKVDSLLCWFTGCLQNLQRGSEDAPWCRVLGQLLELIDHLSCACDHVPSSMHASGTSIDKASLGLAYNLLLLQETAQAVKIVNDTDRDLMNSLQTSAVQMKVVLESFNSSLSDHGFTADAIFEGLQQSLRTNSNLLAEEFAIDPSAALGDAVAQVKSQFDCAATKVDEYKRGKRRLVKETLGKIVENQVEREEFVDACTCVAQQEELLSRITEAIAKVSTSVGFYLDKSLGNGSTLLINFDKVPQPGQMKALIADALQTEIDLLNYELRKDCIEVLDMGMLGSLNGRINVGTLGTSAVMTAMDTEILPEVNEIVTLICVFAIFKGYLEYLEQQSSSSSCMAEAFRRISSPGAASPAELPATPAFTDPDSNVESSAAKSKVLESVHSKFFEMLLMLNGTSDVPCAVERWLACVVNSSNQSPISDSSSSGHHSTGDCALIIPSIAANVSSAINRVQAKLSREQDAQKDILNSLRQRLEQMERERDREKQSAIKCPSCELLAKSSTNNEASCSSCAILRKQLKERLQCTDCPNLRRQIEEYESALASCPNCDRLEKELELEVAHNARLTAQSNMSCNRCEDMKQALEASRSAYDNRVAALQAEFESRLQEQLRIGEEAHRLPRWQNELEQVRQLCDKGIGLAEESHKAEMARLRGSYEKALSAERAEKERLIMEETHATKVALEAIQRQHSCQLAQIKAQTQEPPTAPPNNVNERLTEIKGDIQNISEKFSKKCVEAAAVQERLYTTQKQLQKANTQLFDLLASRARSDTPRATPEKAEQSSPSKPLIRSKTTLDSPR